MLVSMALGRPSLIRMKSEVQVLQAHYQRQPAGTLVTVTAGVRKAAVNQMTPHNWVNHLRCHGPLILVSLVADLHRGTAVMTSWW
jgi:hypothetical protein